MFEKLLHVLSKNLGYTVVLAVSILLFAVFSDGMVAGLITAVSALLAYTCVSALYVEYKKEGAKKSRTREKSTCEKDRKKKIIRIPFQTGFFIAHNSDFVFFTEQFMI